MPLGAAPTDGHGKRTDLPLCRGSFAHLQQENIFMKRNSQGTATSTAKGNAAPRAGSNGKILQSAEVMPSDLGVILSGLQTMRNGDFSVRLPGSWTGLAGKIADTLTETVRLDVDGRPLEGEFLRSANIVNTMIQQLSVFTSEVTRVAREVGTDGKLGGQAVVPGVAGTWKDLTDSVNSMASNLTGQVRNIAEV